jgi:hypothetical protein
MAAAEECGWNMMRKNKSVFQADKKVLSGAYQVHACLVIIGLLAIDLTSSAQDNSSDLVTTNSPFVVYLQNPPWIMEMQFVKARLNTKLSPQNKIFQAWVNGTNRIAIQPSGMFWEDLTPNPVQFTEPASPTQRLVFGISEKNLWQGNIDSHMISFSYKNELLGGSESNHLQRLARIMTDRIIDPVRYFGLPALQVGTFRLVDGNGFTAITSRSQILEGRILTGSDGGVRQLQYWLDGNTNDYFLITYQYGEHGGLPNYIEQAAFRSGKIQPGICSTNWIEHATYGIDASVQNGYTYNMFFTNIASFELVCIESNGIQYLLSAQGVLRPIKNYSRQANGGKFGVKTFVAFLLIVSAGCTILILRSRSQTTTQTTQTTKHYES